MKKTEKIQYDRFIEVVRPNPSDAAPLKLLTGFIGKSSEDNHIRIYTDEELNDFLDIPQNDIIHAEKLSKDECQMGGSRVWVKQDTVFTFGDPKNYNRPKSTFLEGDLMESYNNNFAGQFNDSFAKFKPVPCGWNGHPTIVCKRFITRNCANIRTGNYCGLIYTPPCNLGMTNNNPCRFGATKTGCGLNYSTMPPTTWNDISPVIQRVVVDQLANLQGYVGFEAYNPMR